MNGICVRPDGRLQLPKPWLERLRWRPGDSLVLALDGGNLWLVKESPSGRACSTLKASAPIEAGPVKCGFRSTLLETTEHTDELSNDRVWIMIGYEKGAGTMTRTVRAVFDGQALWPEEPIGIEPDTRVMLTIKVAEKKSVGRVGRRSFLETALSLKLEGPSHGSRRMEKYLYGEGS